MSPTAWSEWTMEVTNKILAYLSLLSGIVSVWWFLFQIFSQINNMGGSGIIVFRSHMLVLQNSLFSFSFQHLKVFIWNVWNFLMPQFRKGMRQICCNSVFITLMAKGVEMALNYKLSGTEFLVTVHCHWSISCLTQGKGQWRCDKFPEGNISCGETELYKISS